MHPGTVESKKAPRGTQSLGPAAAKVQKKRRDHLVCGKGEFLLLCFCSCLQVLPLLLENTWTGSEML